ncbi:MAG: hypothetical protein ACTSYL_06805 [Candidatus Thorarchaeota archaeon]
MKFERHSGSHLISIESRWIGRDLIVAIYGGDAPHVGSISVASVSPSPFRSTGTVSVSTISLPGHKDYVLSGRVAEQLARELGVSVITSIGIHINDATQSDIDTVIETVDVLVDELVRRIREDI